MGLTPFAWFFDAATTLCSARYRESIRA
jgi:hypothetical protein